MIKSVLLRGDPTDDSYVTKIAILATRDGQEWFSVNPTGLSKTQQYVYEANTDSESVKKVFNMFLLTAELLTLVCLSVAES